MEGCAKIGERVLSSDVKTKSFKNNEKLLHKFKKEDIIYL